MEVLFDLSENKKVCRQKSLLMMIKKVAFFKLKKAALLRKDWVRNYCFLASCQASTKKLITASSPA